MAASHITKMFIKTAPGSILVGVQCDLCRSWPTQTEVTVKGLNFIKEDSPEAIGHAIADWYPTL